jgi:hypothetical protein
MSKMMKITTFSGESFPGLLIAGFLSDSRTGEQCKNADSWVEITELEYNAMCDSLGLGD